MMATRGTRAQVLVALVLAGACGKFDGLVAGPDDPNDASGGGSGGSNGSGSGSGGSNGSGSGSGGSNGSGSGSGGSDGSGGNDSGEAGGAEGNGDSATDGPEFDSDAPPEGGLEPGPCRNGVRNLGEQCDDGNDVDVDGCRSDCTLMPELRAQWHFDEPTGTTILIDETARYSAFIPTFPNSLTSLTPAGQVKGALNILQSEQVGQARLEGLTLNHRAGTISIWFNTRTVNPFELVSHIFWIGRNGDGTGPEPEIHINVSYPSHVLTFWITALDPTWCSLSSGAIPLGEWHHAVALYRDLDTKAKCRLFLDGKQVLNRDGGTEPAEANAGVDFTDWPARAFLGRPHSVRRFYHGAVDELMILDRELTPDEILTLHQSQKAAGQPDGGLNDAAADADASID